MNHLPNLLLPHRRRELPRHYSWVDHRLVHDGHLKKISSEAGILYLFLLTVSDQSGLSYYSDKAILRRLKITNLTIIRRELIEADLIAFGQPLYQVLSLPEKPAVKTLEKGDPPDALRSYLEKL